MANFTCDICGGTIKMQANRTGVCQECGMEYDIEAIKAMADNTNSNSPNASSNNLSKNSENTSYLADTKSENQGIVREALLIYLNDVRTIETVIDQSQKKCAIIEKEKEILKNSIITIQSDNISEPEKPVQPENDKIGCLPIVFIVCGVLGILCFLVFVSSNLFWGGIVMLLLEIPLLILGISMITATNSRNNQKMNEYMEKNNKYNRDMANYSTLKEQHNRTKQQKIEKNNQKIDKMNTSYGNIKKEIGDCRSLLNKAYSANIIPMQFRNIEGIYYLYDYLSTSNQTLSEALMQANLEAIKQKLDNMIKLQAVNVIQQAQTNAKLDNIVQQNTQILKTAERTAANTELAAKYAAISAVNSEITKQLSQEQLAYQKADFWLK